MRNKLIAGAILLGATAWGANVLYHNKQAVEAKVFQPETHKDILVRAAKATYKPMTFEQQYTGTFMPFREVMLVPLQAGKVTGLFFQEGDQVAEGKLLLQVDVDIARAQLGAAKAAHQNARTQYERLQKAATGDGISQSQLDNALLQTLSSKAQVEQLEKTIENSQLRAPFRGTVTYKDVEKGAVVGNNPVGRLTDISTLRLAISVPEKEVNNFRKGQRVQVSTDVHPGYAFQGTVDFISDSGDASHNYVVKVRCANEAAHPLKAGMYGNVLLQQQEQQTMLVPRAALLGSIKQPQVYVVQDGKAQLRPVQVGRSNAQEIEVLQGLQAGEQVIVTGLINLRDKAPVKVID